MRKPMRNLAGWRQLLAAALAMATLLWATNKGPDAGNYTATDSTVYSFVDPAGGGGSPSVLTGTDDGTAVLTLPFTFQFYGQSYNLICVSANGIAYFVTSAPACSAPTDFANTDLTSSAVPGDLPAIAPFWMDLSFQTAGAGAVYYQTLGAAGSRQFIMEWYNAFAAGSLSPVTFEAVLYEGSNNVLFQYQTVGPASNGAQATIGIRDSGGNANGRQIQWSYDAAVLANSSAILFTAPSATATSVNTIATSPSGLTVTIDGTPTSTPAVVSWVPGSNHTLSVVASQNNGGTKTTLTSWSTGDTTASIGVVAPTTGITYTATFATQYLLTTSANPSSEGSISAGGFIDAGTTTSVKATATSSYMLKNFSGDLTGSTNPQNLLMNGPKNVVANFGAAFSPCDVTQNGIITVADVQAIINEALGSQTAVDLSGDGVVNVVDVQIVINAVLTSVCLAI